MILSSICQSIPKFLSSVIKIPSRFIGFTFQLLQFIFKSSLIAPYTSLFALPFASTLHQYSILSLSSKSKLLTRFQVFPLKLIQSSRCISNELLFPFRSLILTLLTYLSAIWSFRFTIRVLTAFLLDSSAFWFLILDQLQLSSTSWWSISNVITFRLPLWVASIVRLTFHLSLTLKFISSKSRFLSCTFLTDWKRFKSLCRQLASDDQRLSLELYVFLSRVTLCWFYQGLFQVLSLTASNDPSISDSNLLV